MTINTNKPAAFIIFILFGLITELAIMKVYPLCISNSTNAKTESKKRLLQKEGNYDLIFLGDSSIAGAIDPKLLEQETGLSMFNFALFGDALLAGNYYLLQDYLKHHAQPKAIVLISVYDMWEREADDDHVFESLVHNFPKQYVNFVFSQILSNPRLALKTLHVALPSLFYKYEIRRTLKSPLKGVNLAKCIEKNDKEDKTLAALKGCNVYTEENAVTLNKDLNFHIKKINEGHFFLSSVNEYYLNLLIDETKKRGINLFVGFTPLYEEFYKIGANSPFFQDYKNMLVRLTKNHDHVFLINEDFYPLPFDKLSVTVDHTNPKGTEMFTKLITQRLRDLQSPKILKAELR